MESHALNDEFGSKPIQLIEPELQSPLFFGSRSLLFRPVDGIPLEKIGARNPYS